MATAAGTVTKVALELGDRNPNVVFADTDCETAVDMTPTAVFLHSGQARSAGIETVPAVRLVHSFLRYCLRPGDGEKPFV